MNRKYIVVSLYLHGKGKKIWKSGAVVSASDFDANIEDLVAKNYVKPIEETTTETVELEISLDENPEVEIEETGVEKPLFVVERDGETINVFEEKDIYKGEIISLLGAIENLDFDATDKKSVLWDLLIEKTQA